MPGINRVTVNKVHDVRSIAYEGIRAEGRGDRLADYRTVRGRMCRKFRVLISGQSPPDREVFEGRPAMDAL
jgi:hypothetical protein